MAITLILCDEYGIIYQAMKILPDDELKIGFLEALAELEDNECHRTRKFPKTRLHKVQVGAYTFSILMVRFISRILSRGKDMMM
jgi:hypothetical protein